MNICEHISLAPYTTFGLGGTADYFCVVHTEAEVLEALLWAEKKEVPVLPLGGGSNVLISDAGWRGLVIKIELLDIVTDEVRGLVRIAAGEVWDSVVRRTVELGLQGFETLSLIPGTVGGAVVQNIGAYGTEIGEYVQEVKAIHKEKKTIRMFSHKECHFAYRHSFFKTEEGKQWIVLEVTCELKPGHAPRITFAELQAYIASHAIDEPSITDIRNAVIDIRTMKLPDWNRIGTAGSFFKNPSISKERYTELAEQYPGMPGFDTGNGLVKVSLGWILDKVCGLKGYTDGSVGTYEKQALVLVHYGGGTSHDVARLAQFIAKNVYEKTGITIEPEVEFI